MDKAYQMKQLTEQLFLKGNSDIIEAAFSADYQAHSGGKTFTGCEFIRQYLQRVKKAFPDIKVKAVEILSVSETVVTARRSFTGTHLNALSGIPASGKKVKWQEMIVSRFENDKIAEEWVVSDLAFQLMMKHKSLLKNRSAGTD